MVKKRRIGVFLRHRINHLAREFYRIRGYQVAFGYDFSKATHPHEVEAWHQALMSYYYWIDGA